MSSHRLQVNGGLQLYVQRMGIVPPPQPGTRLFYKNFSLLILFLNCFYKYDRKLYREDLRY